jgi:hypothetical protein
MGDEPDDARWMTYRELAQARGISPASATRLAFRKKWRRQKGNDGIARALVPLSEAEPAKPAVPDVVGVIMGDVAHDAVPDIIRTISALEATLSSLREQLEREQGRSAAAEARVERLEAEFHQEREAARRLAEQIAGLSADLARLAATPPAPVPDSPQDLTWLALINQRQRRRSGPGCRLARSDATGGRPLI